MGWKGRAIMGKKCLKISTLLENNVKWQRDTEVDQGETLLQTCTWSITS